MSADPREIVAAEYGLSPEAASFLTGSTLAEVEESASALVDLLERNAERHQDDRQALDPVSAGLRARDERKRALRDLLTGRRTQPRDEQGRYTGFDGGARQPVRRRDPEREHGRLIADMAAVSRTFGTRYSL